MEQHEVNGHLLEEESRNEEGITYKCARCEQVISFVFYGNGIPSLTEEETPPDTGWFLDPCT